MQENESRRLARYILTNGKVIQDRVIRFHTMQLDEGRHKSVYRELTMAQLHTVMSIYNSGQVTMTELSALTKVSPPSASAMVDRLVEKGVLVREHSSEDRRKVLVKISPKAVNNIRRIENGMLQSLADLVEKIGHKTARQWCQVLDKIQSALDEDNP